MNTGRIVLLLSYISIASASAAILTPALPLIEQQYVLAHGQVEWIMNIFLIGYTLGQIIYGPLANRVGRLGALRIGFGLNILGIIICLIASMLLNSYQGVLVGRFVTALGASAGLSCTFILLNESLSQQKAKRILSFAVVSFTAGIGIAVLLGGIITQYCQWQACFLLLLAHGIFVFFSVSLFKETLSNATRQSILTLFMSYLVSLSHKKIWAYSILVGLVSLFSYCYSVAAPEIAQQKLGLTPAFYGYYNMINMLGMLLGALAASRLLIRYSNYFLLVSSGSVLLALFFLLALIAYENTLTAVSFFTITAACYFVSSIIFPAASHQATNSISDKANASGSMNLINMSSAVLGVAVIGYLPFTMLWSLIVITIVFAIVAMTTFLIFR